MANRIITVEVTGDSTKYAAMVTSMREQNRVLYGQAQQGAAQTVQAMRVWESSLTGVIGLVGKLGAAFGAFRALNFIQQFSAYAEQLNAVSKRTGIAVEDLNALERAAKLNEATFEELTTGFRFLGRALAQAKDPTSEQAKALKALNITSTDLMGAFLQLSDRMKDNLDVNNRYLASNILLGRSSEGLINFMVQGSAKIREQIDEQKRLGVVSKETAEKADEIRDKWGQLKDVFAVKIGGPAIDFLDNLITRLKNTGAELSRMKQYFTTGQGSLNFFGGGTGLTGITGPGQFAPTPFLSAGAATEAAAGAAAATAAKNKIDLAAAIKAGDLGQKQAEAAAKLQAELLKAKQASAEFARAQGDLTVDVAAATRAVIENERAADLLAAKNNQTLTPAVRNLINAVADAKLETLKATEADRLRKEQLDLLKRSIEAEAQAESDRAAVIAGTERDNALLKQRTLDEIELEKQLIELQAERLQITGKTQEAEALRLQARIVELQKLREEESKTSFDTRLRDAQILNAQTALQKIGAVTIDIGGHVATTLNDIFGALITGTLKSVDIGKSALATVGRIGVDIFKQAITDKLKFELTLFSNLRNLPGQASAAITAGGGSNGILNTILFGTAGQLSPNTTFTLAGPGQGFSNILTGGNSAGGGISGFLNGILNMIGGLFGASNLGGTTTLGGIFPGGFSLGGLGTAGIAGGLIGRALGGNSIGSTIGGIRGQLFNATALGQSLSSSITSSLSGALGQSVAEWIGGAVFPLIGAIIGGLTGSLNTHRGRAGLIGGIMNAIDPFSPTAVLSPSFSGINLNQLTNVFDPGTISVGLKRRSDIKGSSAFGIASEVEQILTAEAEQWTKILDVFPDVVKEQMLPALEITNQRLAFNFQRLKFTERGSRNIREEIDSLKGPEGHLRFLDAILPAFGTGLSDTLALAGIDVRNQIFSGITSASGVGTRTGLTPPTDMEGFERLGKALATLASIAGGLEGVNPGKAGPNSGLVPFLTDRDIASLQEQFERVVSLTDPTLFSEAVEGLAERIRPITEFLQSAVSQSTELFGRGLISALDQATASDARLAFLSSLNQGVRDVVFSGISDAFIASAQFQDVLAPVQKVIRDAVQRAIETGQPPDIQDFRSQILPAIELISSRGTLLEPLLSALQELGLNIRSVLGLVPEPVTPEPVRPAPGPTNVVINVNGGNTDEVMNAINKVLGGVLPPP